MIAFIMNAVHKEKTDMTAQTQNEREYRSLMTRIGGALLIFVGLISISQTIYMGLDTLLPDLIGEKAGYLVSNLLYAAMYFASFTVPVAFFRLFSKNKRTEPMRLAPRLTSNTVLLLLAAIGIIFACATVNNMIIQPFMSENHADIFMTYDYSEPYKIIVQFISISLVPGICEEFLFRGMILSNLLPYGKTQAVIISALLFGLMHQNPLQMFYATMAGVILALLYIYTDSILCCTLAHIANNGISVLEEVLAANLPEADQWIIWIIDILLFAFAALAILLLLLKKKHKFFAVPDLREGIFEKKLPESEDYARYPIAPERRMRLLFAPTIIIFIAVSAVQMLYIMVLLMI